MIVEAIRKLVKKEDLDRDEIISVMNEVLSLEATDSQIAAFLTALRMKGETIDEITACVELLREKGEGLNLEDRDVIDIVGTGGDGSNTFNISTATAFVVASGGIKVAKHGSRASSSKSGAADVLEALGANIYLDVKQNTELLNEIGICFMFAPKFNPLMKNAANVRREIKIRTIFNCLGPLINPARAKTQLIGVYEKKLVEPVCSAMKNLGTERGAVLFGECGLDEASVVSDTYYARINNGEIQTGKILPEELGIKRAELKDIQGGDSNLNAEILMGIFQNKIQGAKKDVVALNAAFAFFVSNKTDTIENGFKLACELIESGAAYEKLNSFIEGTNEYSG